MGPHSDGKPHYYYPIEKRVEPSTVDCDICVYGATSAGVAAAVQAAISGKSVALLGFDRHLGGMTTSGLGATDTGNTHVIGGLSRQFYRDVGSHYGKEEAWLFEPHVAAAVYRGWIEKHRVPVYPEQRLSSLEKSGTRIVSVSTEAGATFRAAVYIDATYEGDLMARAGVGYTVGRESDSTYTELFNGIQYGHHHHFLRFVDPYRKPGDAGSGLLYGVSDMGLGTQGQGDKLIQAYNFRLCLTQDERNKVPFPNLVDYTASKGGVEMFTKVAAVELGPYGITVNCVAPGSIEIERTKHEAADYAATWAERTPLRRIGYPADVAQAVAFLAGPDAAFITAQTIWVDGGLYSTPNWPYSGQE